MSAPITTVSTSTPTSSADAPRKRFSFKSSAPRQARAVPKKRGIEGLRGILSDEFLDSCSKENTALEKLQYKVGPTLPYVHAHALTRNMYARSHETFTHTTTGRN